MSLSQYQRAAIEARIRAENPEASPEALRTLVGNAQRAQSRDRMDASPSARARREAAREEREAAEAAREVQAATERNRAAARVMERAVDDERELARREGREPDLPPSAARSEVEVDDASDSAMSDVVDYEESDQEGLEAGEVATSARAQSNVGSARGQHGGEDGSEPSSQRKRAHGGAADSARAAKRANSERSSPPFEITNSTQELEDRQERVLVGRQNTRIPWVVPQSHIDRCKGHRLTDGGVAAYDIRKLRAFDPKEMSNAEAFRYWTELFHEYRYYNGKRALTQLPVATECTATAQAWEAFVHNVSRGYDAWMRSFNTMKEKFARETVRGAKMRVHRTAIEAGLPCAVPGTLDCPLCFSFAERLDELKNADSSVVYQESERMPHELVLSLDALRNVFERRQAQTDANRARTSSIGGAASRTRGRHLARPRSDRFDPPRYLTREDTPTSGPGTSAAGFDHGLDLDDQPGDQRASVKDRPRPSVAAAVGDTQERASAPVSALLLQVENEHLKTELVRERLEKRFAEMESLLHRMEATLESHSRELAGLGGYAKSKATLLSAVRSEVQHVKLDLGAAGILGAAQRKTSGGSEER